MERVALVPWIVMGLSAIALSALWVARGGLRRQDRVLAECFPSMAIQQSDHVIEGKEGVPLYMVMMILQMSLAGLLLWIGVINNGELDDAGLAWVAVALAAAICGTGLVMVHRLREAGRNLERGFVENELPKPLVGLFAVAAVATVVLTVLAAAGVGD